MGSKSKSKSNRTPDSEKVVVAYVLFGIAADVAQLGRGYLRGSTRAKKKNVAQIIGKLETIRGSL